MSELSDFLEAGFTEASATIGTESLSIDGGDSVDVVKAESTHEREWEGRGYQSDASLSIVCQTSEFEAIYLLDATDYVGKPCTLEDIPWKIGTIKRGDYFMTIELLSLNQAE